MNSFKIKNIKYDHPLVYMYAQKRYKEQRGEITSLTFLHEFYWEKTIEGYDVWRDVNNGVFDSFYTFHNVLNTLSDIKEKDNQLIGFVEKYRLLLHLYNA